MQNIQVPSGMVGKGVWELVEKVGKEGMRSGRRFAAVTANPFTPCEELWDNTSPITRTVQPPGLSAGGRDELGCTAAVCSCIEQ